MKKGAIILAAGTGSRMKSKVKKQFMPLDGKPLIWYALHHFTEAGVDDIVLVTGADDLDYVRGLVAEYGFSKVHAVTEGGKERYDSVYRGLCALKELGYTENDLAAIHDGARPFANADILKRNYGDAAKYGTSSVGMPSKDTIKISEKMEDGTSIAVGTPDRRSCWNIQTPQTFACGTIWKAYEGFYAHPELQDGITDDAMLVDRVLGIHSHLTEGSYRNIKVTTPEDWIVAEAFLKAENKEETVLLPK